MDTQSSASETQTFTRGPLRTEVDTSSPQVSAGPPFSLYVTVTNPYDVPARIRAIRTIQPVEFVPMRRGDSKRSIFHSMREEFNRQLHRRIADKPLTDASASNPGAEYITAVSAGSPLADGLIPPEGLLLQPGNSLVQVFTLRSEHSTFFPPAAYNLEFQTEYEIDGRVNQDTISYKLTVRAPLKAVILGGAIGALLGWLVRQSTESTATANAVTFQEMTVSLFRGVTAVVIGGISVVALARKRDAQPFISIEDFWGGLFVGFVAGYGGTTFLQTLIHSPSPSTASPSH